jgi:hypothetical protein
MGLPRWNGGAPTSAVGKGRCFGCGSQMRVDRRSLNDRIARSASTRSGRALPAGLRLLAPPPLLPRGWSLRPSLAPCRSSRRLSGFGCASVTHFVARKSPRRSWAVIFWKNVRQERLTTGINCGPRRVASRISADRSTTAKARTAQVHPRQSASTTESRCRER